LEINVNVLDYSISGKKAESLSDAQLIAQNPQIITAVKDNDNKTIAGLSTSILLAKKESFSVIVNKDAEVLVRADDPDKVGGSLSEDPLIKKALDGDNASSIVTTDGVLAPEVSVRSSAPIKSGSDTIGAVLVGTAIDNAFVDGLKEATGLDASVYADNIRSATTFIAPDGKSRWVGIKEETDAVKKSVLVDGDLYKGSVNILSTPYFSAFLPLKDVDGRVVGMLFVGQPQINLLRAASSSIELTFLVTAALLIASVFPAYFVSRYIINQIR
jgi:methyl-accepting chemotaxis protein